MLCYQVDVDAGSLLGPYAWTSDVVSPGVAICDRRYARRRLRPGVTSPRLRNVGILFVMGFPAVTRTAHARSVVLAEISTLTLFTSSDAPLTVFTVCRKKMFKYIFCWLIKSKL